MCHLAREHEIALDEGVPASHPDFLKAATMLWEAGWTWVPREKGWEWEEP